MPFKVPSLKKKSANNFVLGKSGKLRHISKDMKEHSLWLMYLKIFASCLTSPQEVFITVARSSDGHLSPFYSHRALQVGNNQNRHVSPTPLLGATARISHEVLAACTGVQRLSSPPLRFLSLLRISILSQFLRLRT